MISKASEKFRSILNFKNILLAAGFLALVCIVFYYNSKDINLKIAYGGYGPQDYVAQKLHPENFTRNWPNGILNYDHSIPMRAYYYLAKYCGISPSVTVYPFMFIQTLLFLLSVAFLTQNLFKNKFVTFISVIVISSIARSLNSPSPVCPRNLILIISPAKSEKLTIPCFHPLPWWRKMWGRVHRLLQHPECHRSYLHRQLAERS